MGLIFCCVFPCVGIVFLCCGICSFTNDIVLNDKERILEIQTNGAFMDCGCLHSVKSVPYDNFEEFKVEPTENVKINGRIAATLKLREKSGVEHELSGLRQIDEITTKAQVLTTLMSEKVFH
ncbi:hypothetical protein ABK040_012411 [Willaertia magna]